jgi:hypothetical protein
MRAITRVRVNMSEIKGTGKDEREKERVRD